MIAPAAADRMVARHHPHARTGFAGTSQTRPQTSLAQVSPGSLTLIATAFEEMRR
jgi:hypothetical protein